MLVMVIEKFGEGARTAVYERLAAQGRMIPDGVRYLDSWVEDAGDRCFQLMECDSVDQLEPWIAAWNDLVAFEVVPIITSTEAANRTEAGERASKDDGGRC